MKCSQDDFANIIGVGRTQYSRKENGKSPWSLQEAFDLLEHINLFLTASKKQEVTIEEIFFAE